MFCGLYGLMNLFWIEMFSFNFIPIWCKSKGVYEVNAWIELLGHLQTEIDCTSFFGYPSTTLLLSHSLRNLFYSRKKKKKHSAVVMAVVWLYVPLAQHNSASSCPYFDKVGCWGNLLLKLEILTNIMRHKFFIWF